MPPLNVPPELKKIAPFIKRAEELDKDKTAAASRLVAYYCRQYAVQQGIHLSTSAEGKACLGEILNDLEKEKAAMSNFTRDEAAFLCRKFAEDIFNKADAEDRAGLGNKSTARTFYAAASFLQILDQFYSEGGGGEADEDKKRIVYSKWKSTEILKAIKEGRTPTPGGYGEEAVQLGDDDDDGVLGEPPAVPPPVVPTAAKTRPGPPPPPPPVSFDAPPMPFAPPPPTPKPFVPPPPQMPGSSSSPMNIDVAEDEGTEVTIGPPPAYPGGERDHVTFDVPSPKSTKSITGGFFGFGGGGSKSKTPTKAEFMDAAELARFALAAIDEKDAELAISRMKDAIAILER